MSKPYSEPQTPFEIDTANATTQGIIITDVVDGIIQSTALIAVHDGLVSDYLSIASLRSGPH